MLSSIRSKFIIVLLLVGTVPLVTSGLASFFIGTRGVIASARQDIGEIPGAVGERIDELLYFRFADISTYAELPVVRTGGDDERTEFFRRLARTYDLYAWLGFVDTAGVVRAASLPETVGRRVGNTAWFRELAGRPQTGVHVEDVAASTFADGQAVVTFTAPVQDQAGRFVGLLHTEVKLSAVTRHIQGVTMGDKGHALLLDRHGRVIGNQDGLVPSGPLLDGLNAYRAARNGLTGVLQEQFVDRPALIAYTPLKGRGPYPGLGWSVLVVMDTAEVFSPIKSQGIFTVGLLLAGIMLIFVLAWWQSGFLARPIKELVAAARRMANGDYGTDLPAPAGRDEIAALTGAFGEMVRTVAAKQMELEESNRELKHADRLKSEFLANMSHELRTPLTVINAFVEMLINGTGGVVNDTQRDYLKEIEDSSNHLLHLISDLLDMAKIDAGRMEVRLEPVDLAELMDSLQAGLSALAARAGLCLEIGIPLGLPPVHADPVKLRHILTNLLDNAIKFTPQGGRVRVEATRQVRPGKDFILVSVADTGPGIPPEHLERIFDKFRQVDGSNTRNHRGTGLGLALCKSLVEIQGGSIWVESRTGEGAHFSFTVPAFQRPTRVLSRAGESRAPATSI